MQPQPVVVLGGTFDPVHLGHLELTRRAAAELGAKTAILVVERGHRHRASSVASYDDRRHLVGLAISDEPTIRESVADGLGGSLVEVVAELARREHVVHVVFGADSARHLDRWDGRARLAPAHLWVVARDRDGALDIDGVAALPITVPSISATQVRFALANGRAVDHLVPPSCVLDIERLYGPTAHAAQDDSRDSTVA